MEGSSGGSVYPVCAHMWYTHTHTVRWHHVITLKATLDEGGSIVLTPNQDDDTDALCDCNEHQESLSGTGREAASWISVFKAPPLLFICFYIRSVHAEFLTFRFGYRFPAFPMMPFNRADMFFFCIHKLVLRLKGIICNINKCLKTTRLLKHPNFVVVRDK